MVFGLASAMLKNWITKSLAPFRWAVRFELERRKIIDSHDLEAELQRRAVQDTADYVSRHMKGISSFDSHLDVLSFALKQTSIPDGLYLEFGVFRGGSINHIAGQVDKPVYGFDSFEGLPERRKDRYEAGHFKVDALPKVRSNVTLIKGWFDKTLPEFLEKRPENVAFLHVDCDLYSSTRTIFSCLAPRIKPGTVIVFDEYFNYPGWRDDEFKAFQELVAAQKLKYEYLSYNCKGEQVCARIKGEEAQERG
ncbi:MAG: TylF/MycF/NovP-related O-methyltransferase [Limisphaerales bacterium]